jgi:hypothetical protein
LVAISALGSAISGRNAVVGIFITIFAQIIQSAHHSVETYCLREFNLSPSHSKGAQAFWGVVFISLFVLPVVSNASGVDGNGIHEDTLETFKMIGHHLILVVLLIFLVAAVSVSSVLEEFDLQHPVVFELGRIGGAWLLQLVIGSSRGIGSQVGESWGWWTWLKLVGFGVISFGVMVHYRKVELLFLQYGTPEPEKTLVAKPFL